MAFGVSVLAAGRTCGTVPPSGESGGAAAVIVPPYRLAYWALPHASAEAASGVRLEP